MLRRTPIHRSAHRPHLFLGGERKLVLSTLALSVALSYPFSSLTRDVLAIVLWTAGLYVFRQMAKSDPYLTIVYLKQDKYQNYYPPRARPFGKYVIGAQRKAKLGIAHIIFEKISERKNK